MNNSKLYCDDYIMLARYRNLVEAFCSKEVSRLTGYGFVDALDSPVFVEELNGVHVQLHELYEDRPSGAFYEVSAKFFVAYHGVIRMQEFSVTPPSSMHEAMADCDLPFFSEGGEA